MGRRRYQWLGWMDPEWVDEIAAKLRNDETVWLVNEPQRGNGKPRPAMVTAAHVEPDDNGRIHLDFGPYGRWPDEQVPEWALEMCRNGRHAPPKPSSS